MHTAFSGKYKKMQKNKGRNNLLCNKNKTLTCTHTRTHTLNEDKDRKPYSCMKDYFMVNNN